MPISLYLCGMNIQKIVIAICLLALHYSVMAQDAYSELLADVHKAAGIYYALPATDTYPQTPPPEGKKAFYISHYGCSAAHYLEPSKIYDEPLSILMHADSLGKLTDLGRDVMQRLKRISEDAHLRTGELTASGIRQIRQQTKLMAETFPEVFIKGSFIDGRSIVLNRCILTMQEALLQLAPITQYQDIRTKASHHNDTWMDPVDKELEALRSNAQVMAHYEAFKAANTENSRLMKSLFNDDTYVKQQIKADELSKQLFLLAGNIQHTELAPTTTLFDIFTPQEIHRHWRIQNAWNYIQYGGYTLNGGHQAYAQRAPLWNLLHMGDSVRTLKMPVTHLRYTTPAMLLSLACLMELDSLGIQTENLDTLENRGWKDYCIAPFGGSIQVIHYRSSPDDPDMLIKVLLNGREARLPIASDCAPYYKWQDVKRYYLRKLYTYEIRFHSKKR